GVGRIVRDSVRKRSSMRVAVVIMVGRVVANMIMINRLVRSPLSSAYLMVSHLPSLLSMYCRWRTDSSSTAHMSACRPGPDPRSAPPGLMDPGLAVTCGYDLHGSHHLLLHDSTMCPECARPHARAARQLPPPRAAFPGCAGHLRPDCHHR